MLAFLLGRQDDFSTDPLTYMDDTNGVNSSVQFQVVRKFLFKLKTKTKQKKAL
jgi:hypothetical protein